MRDDYADMVNPYVRAEHEAEGRGYRRGVWAGAFAALYIAIIAGMILVSWHAHAADWTREESQRVITASERDAQITVCQQNAIERGWACFIVR